MIYFTSAYYINKELFQIKWNNSDTFHCIERQTNSTLSWRWTQSCELCKLYLCGLFLSLEFYSLLTSKNTFYILERKRDFQWLTFESLWRPELFITLNTRSSNPWPHVTAVRALQHTGLYTSPSRVLHWVTQKLIIKAPSERRGWLDKKTCNWLQCDVMPSCTLYTLPGPAH